MKKNRIQQVGRALGGTHKHIAQLSELAVPDCWHVAMRLAEAGDESGSKLVLETWHLCHDLLKHLHKLEKQAV